MLKICSTSKSRKLCYILAATKYAYENVAGNSVVLRGFCFLLLGDFSSLATLLQWKSPWKSSHLVCHTHTLLFYTHNTLISIFQWVSLGLIFSKCLKKVFVSSKIIDDDFCFKKKKTLSSSTEEGFCLKTQLPPAALLLLPTTKINGAQPLLESRIFFSKWVALLSA